MIRTLWFKDLEEHGYSSVTDYCRFLRDNWNVHRAYSLDDTLEIYRGDMLCLTVRTVREGAELEPTSDGFQKNTNLRASKGRGFIKMGVKLPLQPDDLKIAVRG